MASPRDAGLKYQGIDEQIPYQLTTTAWGSSPSSVTFKVYDETTNFTDVTSTVIPSGSASVVGDVITLPLMRGLTEGHVYRVEVKFTCGTTLFEAWFRVQAER